MNGKWILLTVVGLCAALLLLLLDVAADGGSSTLTRVSVASDADPDGDWPKSSAGGRLAVFESSTDSQGQGISAARREIWLYDTATVSPDRARSAWQPAELLDTPTLSAAPSVTVYVHLPAILRSRPPQYAWRGEVVNRYPNCGLTMLHGYTLNQGGVAGDVTLYVWADGWAGVWVTSSWISGDLGNWAVFLNPAPMAGTWYECVVPEDQSRVCISNIVTAVTSDDCVGGFQVVETVFRKN